VKVTDMDKYELDYWSAIAMGASADRKPPENQLVTGLPFLYCHGNPPHFRVVNAAGVSDVWRPSTSWADTAILIRIMAETSSVTLEHRAGQQAASMFGEWRAEANDLRLSLTQLFVMTRLGLYVNEEVMQA